MHLDISVRFSYTADRLAGRSVPFCPFRTKRRFSRHGIRHGQWGVKKSRTPFILIRHRVRYDSKNGAVPSRFSGERLGKRAFFTVSSSVPYSTVCKKRHGGGVSTARIMVRGVGSSVRHGARYGGLTTPLNCRYDSTVLFNVENLQYKPIIVCIPCLIAMATAPTELNDLQQQ